MHIPGSHLPGYGNADAYAVAVDIRGTAHDLIVPIGQLTTHNGQTGIWTSMVTEVIENELETIGILNRVWVEVELPIASDASRSWDSFDRPLDDNHADDPIHDGIGEWEGIEYRGYEHDAEVNRLAAFLEQSPGVMAVLTEVSITIGGVTARPDILVKLANGDLVFIEVKSGYDPRYTENQARVYPHIALGGWSFSTTQSFIIGVDPGVIQPPGAASILIFRINPNGSDGQPSPPDVLSVTPGAPLPPLPPFPRG